MSCKSNKNIGVMKIKNLTKITKIICLFTLLNKTVLISKILRFIVIFLEMWIICYIWLTFQKTIITWHRVFYRYWFICLFVIIINENKQNKLSV